MDVGATQSVPDWQSPLISSSTIPKVIATGRPQENEDYPENFFRCAKWCPDGTRALGQCEDRSLQMLQPPTEVVESTMQSLPLHVNSVFRQPSPILDFAWYPGANASNPASYCFLASVRECPVKLLDAADGRLRASYKIIDHRERQVAPHCLAFNSFATHLYCGYEDAIEVFDFQRPGEGTKIATTPSKKSRDGMKGIVSSIAFCPDYSGLYAASSLASAISLFSETTGEDPVAYLDGMTAPIMQVKFDSARPHILYASQRRSDEILCWDVREPLEVLRRFTRASSSTNQKLLFDIDPAGHWLATGDENGDISIFDLYSEETEPALKFKAHDDSIGSVAFNSVDATLLSVSGSRHFNSTPIGSPSATTSSDSEDTSESEDDLGQKYYITCRRQPRRPYPMDSSVKLWKFNAGIEEAMQVGTNNQDEVMDH
ncbi:WD40 repeat-like protein [Fomitiporia mediterranea MF3/22]|uniref:WD40 repeat-like protein n=1 Tax=Fomitiporia mediterranea (strain MF3/22) TaxID=694068 RepID=UPI00044090EF|nr:WD40 repeat-like protein [Fomitiporia mediterranea MF3/22]EJD01202.1 WD40 repeat-like protein [Fomitiporia mediterranea MF3/22]